MKKLVIIAAIALSACHVNKETGAIELFETPNSSDAATDSSASTESLSDLKEEASSKMEECVHYHEEDPSCAVANELEERLKKQYNQCYNNTTGQFTFCDQFKNISSDEKDQIEKDQNFDIQCSMSGNKMTGKCLVSPYAMILEKVYNVCKWRNGEEAPFYHECDSESIHQFSD